MDFASPLYAKDIYGKSDQVFKSCICLLMRLQRNFHLEVTPSMDASGLIKALVRFFARRGFTKMFIINNFSSFRSSEVSRFLLLDNIDWKFILPSSPWLGGFHKRLSRKVQITLRKILGDQSWNFDMLYTILPQVELLLNSRPLS